MRLLFCLILLLVSNITHGIDYLEYRFLEDIRNSTPVLTPPKINIPPNSFVSFGRDSDGSDYSIKSDHIIDSDKDPDIMFVLQRKILNKERTIEGKPYSVIDSWIEINCRNNLYKKQNDDFMNFGGRVKLIKYDSPYSKIDMNNKNLFITMYRNSYCKK